MNWTFHLLSLNLVFLFHLISLGFLSRARGYFSPSQLLTIYTSQIRPSLEYCSHVWGGAPKSSLHLLDRVQSKAIHLINNQNLTNSLQSLSHRRLAADLSIFYRQFHGHCSQEIKNIIPDPVRRVRTTRRSTYSHLFQVTLPNPRTLSHKSSFIPRTSQLWNSLPPTTFPESYNLSFLKSNIYKLDLISLCTSTSHIFSVSHLSELCYRPYSLSPILLTKKKHVFFRRDKLSVFSFDFFSQGQSQLQLITTNYSINNINSKQQLYLINYNINNN